MRNEMNRQLRIQSVDPDELLSAAEISVDDPKARSLRPRYAALISCVGYEQRSGYIPRRLWSLCGQIWGYSFDVHRVYSFEENRTWFQSYGEFFDEPEGAYRKHLSNQVRQLADTWMELSQGGLATKAPLRLAVDISSMSRERMAQTVLALLDDVEYELQIDWLYAPAKYSDEHLREDGPVSVNRALSGFEGWTDDPAKPAACVLGTGLEGDLALGAVERLEPALTWAFVPKGYDAEYDAEYDARNQQILATVGKTHSVGYSVDQPFTTLLELDLLVSQLRSDYRIVIVALGPKIFALTALLL